MRIVLVGPGRAGMSLGLAMRQAGHDVVGVLARRSDDAGAAAAKLDGAALDWEDELPACDLLMIAVRDDAIGEVAARLAPVAGRAGAAVHLSGLAPVGRLTPLDQLPTGSFHPLQTLPSAAAGAERLAGSWVAVTAGDDELRDRLNRLAASLGAHPFDLDDGAKPLYHAAAAAAANFPLGALAMAEALFAAAGVPFAAARPLVEAVVANAFALGPGPALTGPIARGDVGTVAAQLDAVRQRSSQWAPGFEAFARELARQSGRDAEFRELLG